MRIKEVDFIRGIAIVSVLLMHTIPSSVQSIIQWQIHIGQAVPLYFLITLFLSFQGLKKNNGKCVGAYYSKKHIIRVFANVVCPALIVGSIQMIIDAASGGSAWRASGLLAWGG